MRWRYGLAVDLIAFVWAVGCAAIGVIALSGLMRVRSWPEALAIVAMGALAVVVETFASWQTVRMVREGRADGDVRRPDQG